MTTGDYVVKDLPEKESSNKDNKEVYLRTRKFTEKEPSNKEVYLRSRTQATMTTRRARKMYNQGSLGPYCSV